METWGGKAVQAEVKAFRSDMFINSKKNKIFRNKFSKRSANIHFENYKIFLEINLKKHK